MNIKVADIVRVTGGRLLSGDPDALIDPSCISTDSRLIKKGGFFIALKGDKFDGNAFVGDVHLGESEARGLCYLARTD